MKNGNVAIDTLFLVIMILMIVVVTIFVVSNILPFIMYEKLNNIAIKYMFVVEKFGYLSSKEKENLKQDLKASGFDVNKLTIEVPTERKMYGELINFKISYDYYIKIPNIVNLKIIRRRKDKKNRSFEI